MIANKNKKASINKQILDEYIAFGAIPEKADLQMVQDINDAINEHNKANPDDQLDLIDSKPYLDYGLDFASDDDEKKFREYIKAFSVYSFMNLAGKPVIVKPYTEDGVFKYEFSSVNDFRTFHKQDHFFILDGKKYEKMYFANFWLENETMRKRYTTTVFDPSNKHSHDAFNFWRGYIKPIKGNHQPFIDHIGKLIKGDQAEKDYIIKLLAYSVRFPNRLTSVALAFRGAQGAGKSTISETMRELCPNHTKVFDSMDVLFDFNAETVHTKYFLMEESVWGGEVSKQGKLKNLITCQHRAIKVKNLTGFDIKNYGFFIFTSNEAWMLPVEKGDRRFSIFDCTKDLIDKFDYFDTYYSWLRNGGANALLHYFLYEIDLTGFNPKTVVSNSAKTDVKTIGLPPVERFILGALSDDICVESLTNVSIEQNQDEKYEMESWDFDQIKVNRTQLYTEFCDYTKREKVDQTLFSRKLAEIFQFPINWKTSWKSGKNYYYKLSSKVHCMEMFAEYLKEKPEQLFPSYKDMKSKQ